MPMPVILRNLPFFERPTQLAVHGELMPYLVLSIIPRCWSCRLLS
jgi:hypothetical protein